jgi:F-box/leucine-rich repeat protein 2/20
MNNLEDLDVSYCDSITDAGINMIANMNNLQTINLNYCDRITEVSVRHLHKCNSLHCVSLSIYSSINDALLSGLAKANHSLSVIELWKCDDVTDAGIATLASNCPNLQTLFISEASKLTDLSLESLAKCINLEMLILGGYHTFTDKGFVALANGCTSLQGMNSNCSNVS